MEQKIKKCPKCGQEGGLMRCPNCHDPIKLKVQLQLNKDWQIWREEKDGEV